MARGSFATIASSRVKRCELTRFATFPLASVLVTGNLALAVARGLKRCDHSRQLSVLIGDRQQAPHLIHSSLSNFVDFVHACRHIGDTAQAATKH